MGQTKMYQVSTLQALAMGYTKGVVTVKELLKHGDTGLGTFTNVDGEMIVVDDRCYRALEDGTVEEADGDLGVPFSSVTRLAGQTAFTVKNVTNIAELKTILNNKVDEGYGLNSMHVARIDGVFRRVDARSEAGYESRFVSLKDILSTTQKDFRFEEPKGTLVCVYYPDYMDGVNAPGWHLHFVSEDRKQGGHVFELDLVEGTVKLDKISNIEIQLPEDREFDVYSLKDASKDEIRQVEQAPGTPKE